MSNPTCDKGCKYVDDVVSLRAELAEARRVAVGLARMVIVAQEACDKALGNKSCEGDNIHEAADVIEKWGQG